MFGGFGRRKERDVGELKRQQLEALKQQVPQVRAVNAEETVLDVPIPSASSTAVLRVQLPPQFPDHAPALRLLGIVIRHQWVDPGGLVAYHPRLNPWHSNNSLAEVVVDVINEVTKTAGGSPTVAGAFNNWAPYPGGQAAGGTAGGYPGQPPLAYQGGGPGAAGATAGGASPGASQPPGQYGGPQQPPPIVLPPLPTALPNEMGERASVEELNKLLSDEVAFSVFLSGLSQVKECNRQLEAIRRTNADVARATLRQKEELTSLRDEVAQQVEVMNALKKAYEGKLKANKAAIGGGATSSGDGGAVGEVTAALEKEAAESEERSEATARAFRQGQIKLPEFETEFLRERRKYHERQAKIEKLQKLQQEQGGR